MGGRKCVGDPRQSGHAGSGCGRSRGYTRAPCLVLARSRVPSADSQRWHRRHPRGRRPETRPHRRPHRHGLEASRPWNVGGSKHLALDPADDPRGADLLAADRIDGGPGSRRVGLGGGRGAWRLAVVRAGRIRPGGRDRRLRRQHVGPRPDAARGGQSAVAGAAPRASAQPRPPRVVAGELRAMGWGMVAPPGATRARESGVRRRSGAAAADQPAVFVAGPTSPARDTAPSDVSAQRPKTPTGALQRTPAASRQS